MLVLQNIILIFISQFDLAPIDAIAFM